MTFGPRVTRGANSVQPAPVQRSTVKLSSLPELSVHVRLICDADAAVACRFEGAAGAVGAAGVVAPASFENPDGPTAFEA